MNDQAVVQSSVEDQELLELREKWTRYPKLSKWFDLYFDASNKETFHNQTEAAILAYNLDPNSPADRKTAWEIGCQNSKKLKVFAQKVLEQLGWTKVKVIELIAAKAVSSNNSKFVLMLADLTEVYEEKPRNLSQTNVNVQTGASGNDAQISLEEEQRLSKDFAEFVNAKYVGKPAMNPDAPQGTTG